MDKKEPVLELRGISKSFGFVEAVKGVDWQVYPGEVAALVGDNGAGKSTLIKMICGALKPDAGELWINGIRAEIAEPADAFRLGIAPVYQDLALVDNRDVVMNMFLGGELTHGLFNLFLDHQSMANETQRVLDEIHSRIPNVREMVRKLSGGQRQAVAVGRALIRGGEVIIMDEPTAALGVEQTAEVLNLIETLRSRGKTVIFISHNIGQVIQVSDQISVMFHGQMVGTRRTRQTNNEEIVAMIVGTKKDTDRQPIT